MTLRSLLPFLLVGLTATGCATFNKGMGIEHPAATPEAELCYTGLLIVSDDEQIELQGCPAEWEVFIPMGVGNADPEGNNYLVGRSIIEMSYTPNVMLTEDQAGRYYLPEALSPEPAYLTLVDDTPFIHVTLDGTPYNKPLFPAYEVNHWVSAERKLTPFITPDVLGPPLLEMAHLDGEHLSGTPWHLLPGPDQGLIVTAQ